MVSLAQVSSPHSKTVSSLEVQKKEGILGCDKEEEISIKYTVVGEAEGDVDLMYLVSTGIRITHLNDETPESKTYPTDFCFFCLVSVSLEPVHSSCVSH